MSETHLERIADLLPDDQREQWLRLSSRFTNANKDTDDEIWLLAELIAMVGLASREQGGGDEMGLLASPDGKSREIAEKQRQTAATMERLSKSLAEMRPHSKEAGSMAIPVLLTLVLLSIGVVGWMIWRIIQTSGIVLFPQ